MKEYVVCKSCGFVMEKGKLKDKCPACGVPAKMFEPYVEKVSAFRKLILSLDIHPVMVHFPQAFTFTILLLSILAIFVRGEIQSQLFITIGILSILLPFTVILTFLAGLLDGKIRFRRVTTPILVRKMVLASIFFVFAAAILILNILYKLENPLILCSVIVLSAGCLVWGTLLAKLGTSLLNAKFPG